jgi:hypothetical protein
MCGGQAAKRGTRQLCNRPAHPPVDHRSDRGLRAERPWVVSGAAPGSPSVESEQQRWNIGVVRAATMEHRCRCGHGRQSAGRGWRDLRDEWGLRGVGLARARRGSESRGAVMRRWSRGVWHLTRELVIAWPPACHVTAVTGRSPSWARRRGSPFALGAISSAPSACPARHSRTSSTNRCWLDARKLAYGSQKRQGGGTLIPETGPGVHAPHPDPAQGGSG